MCLLLTAGVAVEDTVQAGKLLKGVDAGLHCPPGVDDHGQLVVVSQLQLGLEVELLQPGLRIVDEEIEAALADRHRPFLSDPLRQLLEV